MPSYFLPFVQYFHHFYDALWALFMQIYVVIVRCANPRSHAPFLCLSCFFGYFVFLHFSAFCFGLPSSGLSKQLTECRRFLSDLAMGACLILRIRRVCD